MSSLNVFYSSNISVRIFQKLLRVIKISMRGQLANLFVAYWKIML